MAQAHEPNYSIQQESELNSNGLGLRFSSMPTFIKQAKISSFYNPMVVKNTYTCKFLLR